MQRLLSCKRCTRVIELEEIWQIVQLLLRNYACAVVLVSINQAFSHHSFLTLTLQVEGT